MIERDVIVKILCATLVAAVLMPLGYALFPYVSGELSGTQFHAIEAVIGATAGFGISAIFG
ncbi:MAG: hypothetical protein HY244_12875 [Rhizobiales bacterium]|nr:hypothetical protein [Hyphomicrobiales bacterium]